jgi:RNA polymerase sigma-70 factor (ECF subfamily)
LGLCQKTSRRDALAASQETPRQKQESRSRTRQSSGIKPHFYSPEVWRLRLQVPSGFMDQRPPSSNGSSAESNGRHSAPQNGSPAGGLPDDQLVAAAQSGDQAAFAQLIHRHQRAVYGYLRCRLVEPADAEDLCQEVFLRSYQSEGHFETPGMVRPWLIGIARNVLREHVRRVARRKEIGWTALCLEVDHSLEPVDPLYDDVVHHLPGCMDSLGQSARDALELHYRNDLRLAQIGERLRRSEGAIKLLMFRARQFLRDCISQKCTSRGGSQKSAGAERQ